MTIRLWTKDAVIEELKRIRARGWIESARPGNAGSVGNTLEDLLGIEENNLPIPNAGEWELKCHRMGSKALTTLFHTEPSPRGYKWVPSVLLPKYGWPHKQAAIHYPDSEMSFRQTVNAVRRTDRGFKIVVDQHSAKVLVSFDPASVSHQHQRWLDSVRQRAGGLGEIDPQPYWSFADLKEVAESKLRNCFFVLAEAKKTRGKQFYYYRTIQVLHSFSFEKFLMLMESGLVFVDFDARTGHNHGTKFRIRAVDLPSLYSEVESY